MKRGVVLALSLSVAVCAGCQRDVPEPPLTCASDAACPSGYHCGPLGTCLGDVACELDGDCCLAQRCQDGRCRRRQMCSTASPCGGPSQRCERGICVSKACNSDADCAKSLACVMGTCRAKPPCGGYCPKSQACAALLDKCVHVGEMAKTCAAGDLAVVANELARFEEGCGAIASVVQCRKLPRLVAGQYGQPGVVASSGKSLAVIAYDRTWGDLVLARHGAAPPHDRTLLKTIAGLPTDAPVIADPTGPRGGVGAPGVDAGSRFSVGRDAKDGLHIAYYDVTNHALRYVDVSVNNAVTRDHLIVAGAGRAVALASDAVGVPWIATFADPKEGDAVAGTRKIVLLKAANSAPATTKDWTSQDLLAAELPARAPTPIGPAVRRGVGAHLALAVRDGKASIAAYDSEKGHLVLARGAPGSTLSTRTLDGKLVNGGSSDLGRFPALLVGSDGKALITCQDAQKGRLVLLTEAANGTWSSKIVDSGVRKDGHHRVGADAKMVRAPDGGVVIAYQDTRSVSLYVVRVTAKGTVTAPFALSSTAASGFSAGLVSLGDKAVVVGSARLSFDGSGTAKMRYGLVAVVIGSGVP